MKYLIPVLITFTCLVLVETPVYAFSFDPPNEKTGAPGEGNCTQCHTGNTLNTAGGSLDLSIPETYIPGTVYDIVVKLARDGQKRWGFEMTALTPNNTRAGTFSSTTANTQIKESNNKQYIKQTSAGTAQGTEDMYSWTFKWTAPSSQVGPISFYAAGNAADGTFGTNNDYIYTQSSTSELVSHGVSITTDDNSKETTDANTGVEYKISVTNTGNVADTIILGSSAEVGIGGAVLGSFKNINSQDIPTSQLEVTLNPGENSDVIFIASGDLLTRPGEYPITITATSKGNPTKNAEITTTTTILPIYGVILSAVGQLSMETTDASSGIKYKFRVTNTGNASDRINLSTTGDVSASISPTTITLSSGSSAEVELTIPGSELVSAGSYDVTITATSNNDSSKKAQISTTTTILPIYGIVLSGIGDLTTETSDASDGVSYKFTVSNTGNTDDVIDLSISGDVSGTLSQTTVSLSYGTSKEITLTIPGSALVSAGSYDVTITATSNNDSSKKAQISTTTTILPIYGIVLSGIGDLTTETSDASDGVSYKFTVSNTGNTDDVIDLSISGDVSGTLSQSTVSLSYGTSKEVSLTIPGSVLAIAGDYSVMVTATSQGDSSKSSVVSTITTILPVYDISISTPTRDTDITDGKESYIFTVTNNGNTDDIIHLSSTGDVKTTLNRESVSLAPGVSEQIILTITTVELTAGNYSVTLTGTSEGDISISTVSEVSITIGSIYSVMFSSEDELKGNTIDILTGVSYQLTLTNTGNIEDTVLLSSSAEVGIEGSVLGSFKAEKDQEISTSQVEITLKPGSSVSLTFTTSGDYFTKPGEYEIIVTATSIGDKTKTDELKITTTIAPVVWDLNADGIVNILDLVSVSNQFGKTGEGLTGDVNEDGTVNILDLVQVASYFGKSQVEIIEATR